MMGQCQWIGPQQDPRRDFPLKFCGAQVVAGRHYCHDHLWLVYKKDSAMTGRRKEKAIEQEIKEINRV
jgi:hypothetical protein